ncbi:GNAT family N-acetyltransferase [Roseivirga sp. 4D4]|uniref:GNAT family N-acetyltransferase n=1 Tax=Roseivirga sp. 4D4 TaxID=1889784 RepID=UPI0008533299|nr:GNAT family N-acetyltransferase [Roseivirga sp. 4D4]OEK02990.1 GNAT family N-acetyltransferase [Roseivirga sp. 4D4]
MLVRKGTPADLEAVFDLVMELAIYEKAPHEVANSVERMREDGFGDKPVFEFFVAEERGNIVGTAIYYYRYSTWKGKALYLEDLVVRDSERGKGYGKMLLDAIVLEAKRTDSKQVRWQVLDWNEPAINFYKKLGADLDGEWINCTLTEEQIQNYQTD